MFHTSQRVPSQFVVWTRVRATGDGLGLSRYPTPIARESTLGHIDDVLTLVPAQDTTSTSHLNSRPLGLASRTTPDTFGDLPLPREQTWLHGDFTKANLFFRTVTVSAVLDWELAKVGPATSEEVFRTCHFCFDDKVKPWSAFLAACRTEREMSTEELDLGAELFAEHRARVLWEFDAVYREGNDHARKYSVAPASVPDHPLGEAARRRSDAGMTATRPDHVKGWHFRD